MILLFDLLQLLDDEVIAEKTKLHLAVWNGVEDPLDVWMAGEFDAWQQEQTRRNFQRDLIVSLIGLPQPEHWLFAGVHDSHGCEWDDTANHYRYSTSRRTAPDELDGRLVVHFKRRGRTSYLLGERWESDLFVAEIRPDKLQIAEFPGYSATMLSKQQLDLVVKERIESWRSALANVAGVYVIADRKTGKLYVGSATAEKGLWSRWCSYSRTGHGGNRELKEVLERNGDTYASNFQFGVLEIADSNVLATEMLRREARWKELLLTRKHGYNRN